MTYAERQDEAFDIRSAGILLVAVLAVFAGIRIVAALAGAAGTEAAPPRPAAFGTVDAVAREGGTTRVRLSLNNHQYDMTDPGIRERSSLEGVVPAAYEVLSGQGGGHHVTADLVFDGDLNGDLV